MGSREGSPLCYRRGAVNKREEKRRGGAHLESTHAAGSVGGQRGTMELESKMGEVGQYTMITVVMTSSLFRGMESRFQLAGSMESSCQVGPGMTIFRKTMYSCCKARYCLLMPS